MELRRLSDEMSVSDQITPDDIPALKDAGVTTLIINRPDAEVGPELSHTVIEKAAREAGLAVRYVPYVPGPIDSDLIEDFAEAVALPGPAHAYCRSGTRSTTLWALSQAGSQPTEAIIAAAADAGYDISGMATAIEARGRFDT